MTLPRRLIFYIILGILCKVVPYIVTVILILITMDRIAGMRLGVIPGIIIVHLLFGMFFLRIKGWIRIITTIIFAGIVYGLVVLASVNKLIRTEWDIYGYWDLAITNFLAGVLIWELGYHFVHLLNRRIKKPIDPLQERQVN